MTYRSRLRTTFIFAIAMAWLEAAVVIYLRTMVDRIEPYQPDPLPLVGQLGAIELGREAATLLMLLSFGWVCGRSFKSRLAFAAMAFGAWDIFYYVFLRAMGPWPNSLLDWDILFLLPLPWWGPVLAPVLTAALLILGGALFTYLEEGGEAVRIRALPLLAAGCGALLALSTFMANALRMLPGGSEAVRQALPTTFNWLLFSLSLGLMSVPVISYLPQLKQAWGREGAE